MGISTGGGTNKDIIIINIYRPPNDIQQHYKTFIDEFAKLLSCFEKSNSEIIITGDLNIDLLKINQRPIFSEFYDILTASSYLPKIVDNHCLFKQHVSYICKKAHCSTNVLFRCFHTANTAALIRGYKSFIRPVLEYCSTVWNPYIHARHFIGMTDQLENVQRYFTRRVYYRCKLEY